MKNVIGVNIWIVHYVERKHIFPKAISKVKRTWLISRLRSWGVGWKVRSIRYLIGVGWRRNGTDRLRWKIMIVQHRSVVWVVHYVAGLDYCWITLESRYVICVPTLTFHSRLLDGVFSIPTKSSAIGSFDETRVSCRLHWSFSLRRQIIEIFFIVD